MFQQGGYLDLASKWNVSKEQNYTELSCNKFSFEFERLS